MMGRRDPRRGVTLIELVVVMSTLAILLSLSSMYVREIFNLWNFVSFRNEVVSQGREAMMRMVREMRQVNNDSSVVSAGADRFSFVDAGNAAVEYSLNGTDLMRNTNVMARGVASLGFHYYDKQNALLAAPRVAPLKTDIASVKVTMELSSGTQSKSFSTRVFPRNLGE